MKFSNRMETLDSNKCSYKIWEEMVTSVDKKIKEVERRIKTLLRDNEDFGKKADLLKTILGVSEKTAVAILSELPDVNTFESAREAAAFAGLTPSIRQSGTSVKGRGSLSKVGNALLRKALFMPTLVAKKHNPVIEKFYEQLTKKGKAKMVVVAAGMRKLLHIIFGVLKNNQPFSCS